MDGLAQNHSSFSASFPTSWAVAANRPSSSLPLPPPLHQSSPPVNNPSLGTTLSSSSPASTSKYLTHFPSSWVLPSAASHSQSQLVSDPEPKYSPKYLTAPERPSFTNSTFNSQMTLRPLLGGPPGSSDPHRLLVQEEDLKQRLLTHISRPGNQDSSVKVSPKDDRKNTSSTLSVLAPMQKEGGVARLPDSTSNGHDTHNSLEGNLQVREECHNSDASGLGDEPYRHLDFVDTYSIYSASSALTNRK